MSRNWTYTGPTSALQACISTCMLPVATVHGKYSVRMRRLSFPTAPCRTPLASFTDGDSVVLSACIFFRLQVEMV
jgi:hypothetical protein